MGLIVFEIDCGGTVPVWQEISTTVNLFFNSASSFACRANISM